MPEQLSLDYFEITPDQTAGRSFLRENYTVSTRVAYKIPFEDIKIRDGFNRRVVYEDMDELCASIKVNGLIEPLTVDVMLDGTVYVERGHRRYKALVMLREQGECFDFVECFVNQKSVTEFDRMLAQYTSNNNQRKLKPVEAAEVAYALKFNYGKELSNEEIAEKMGVSRQQVDNYITIAMAGDDLKNQILVQDLKITKALELIHNEKKLKEQCFREEKKHAQSSLSITADVKDVNADELASLNSLEKDIALSKDEDVRFSNHNPDDEKENGQPLNLVGNTVSDQSEQRSEKGEKKYDESREEIKQIQNIIKLIDKVDVIAEKIPDSQTSKDICDIIKWMRNDAMPLRDWIHSNKKQNKLR